MPPRNTMAGAVLTLMAAVAIAGCTAGEAERFALAESIAPRPQSWMAAVGVRRALVVQPTGIRRFPDGGNPAMLDQEFVVFFIDARTSTVVRREALAAPPELRTSFRGHLEGWRDGTLYVALSGCAGRECNSGQVQRRYFALADDGSVNPVATLPDALERPPGSPAPVPGEEPYVRYSSTGSVISIRTADEYLPRFQLDADGELVPVTRSDP